MAKPKSRIETSAIAGMLGVTKSAADGRGAMGESAVRVPVELERPEGAHPVRDRTDAGVARADNALVLDPRRIERRGRYVRPFTEDRRFHELLSAITEAGGKIHVPVLVRVEGPPGAVEYVLVDGTHRVEAALRLGLLVPAVNLGRVTAEQAFAIQAMANEVRASMHVADQAAYVQALLDQGLAREAVQRTTGFSAGRVSELARIGSLLGALSEPERAQARRAGRVTHRALRTLVASGTADDFRRGVLALIEASAHEIDLDTDSDEVTTPSGAVAGHVRSGNGDKHLGTHGYQTQSTAPGPRRGRAALGAGGVSFTAGRNVRGTSVTFRMAWRARAVREDPEMFLERVRDALQAIAAEATAQYELATNRVRSRGRRRQGGEVGRPPRSWREVIAREEAELGARVADRPRADHPTPGDRDAGVIPETENPIPMPPSRRRPGESPGAISPRLLAGLSLPMLAERLKRRPPEFQQLDTHLADVERQAEEARQRAREVLDSQQPAPRRRP
jgi:hypothetical protein